MLRKLWIPLLLLTLGLSACGFQLRGSVPLPEELQSMSLECPSIQQRSFCQTMERQLEGNGIKSEADNSRYRLKIIDVSTDRRAVSIDERSVASEVEIRLNAQFSLETREGVEILTPTNVTSSQTYRYNQNEVLGKGREEQQIKRDLSQQVSSQIMARLAPLTPERIQSLREANALKPKAKPMETNP